MRGRYGRDLHDRRSCAGPRHQRVHELETKYIFGFTIGSSIGIEGERAFEPDTVGGFGKPDGTYAATETELEIEYTPSQFVQIEFGPTVSYYNIHNVTGVDDRSMGSLNGFEADFRYLVLDRGPSRLRLRFRPNRNFTVSTKRLAQRW
jgi:hypothetical protein